MIKTKKYLTKLYDLSEDIVNEYRKDWVQECANGYNYGLEEYLYFTGKLHRPIEFTRIKNSYYGNPRYVIHHTNMLSKSQHNDISKAYFQKYGSYLEITSHVYDIALKKAKVLGGKKYHNKSYGGGIVFESYNIQDLEQEILSFHEDEQ